MLTCEAEYIVATTAACQRVWLCRLLHKLTGEEARAPMLMDYQPAIALAKNPVLHDRSKHIDIKYHFICDCVDGGQIVLEFSSTLGGSSQTASLSLSGVFGSRSFGPKSA